MAVNLVGLFVHNLMEVSQRKAFLDTRNCIAARLDMEDENEKLVSFFLPPPFPLTFASLRRLQFPTRKKRPKIFFEKEINFEKSFGYVRRVVIIDNFPSHYDVVAVNFSSSLQLFFSGKHS